MITISPPQSRYIHPFILPLKLPLSTHYPHSPPQMSLDLEVLPKSRIAAVTSPTHSLTLLQKSRVQVLEKGCKTYPLN